MSTTSVSRRFFKAKTKDARRKPVAKVVDRVIGGSSATPLTLGIQRVRVVPLPWWRNRKLHFGAIALIVIVLVIVAIGRLGKVLSGYQVDVPQRPAWPEQVSRRASPGAMHSTQGGATSGGQGTRSPPTDASFLATPYQKHKVISLPDNVSGQCDITGFTPDEFRNCLLRHGGK